MISVQMADQRFPLRAAAVVVHAGHGLLHRLEGDTFWTLPGGRSELGEDARVTVVREMAEELGEPVACSDLLYVVENLFTPASQKNHEFGFYSRVELVPGSTGWTSRRTTRASKTASTWSFAGLPPPSWRPWNCPPVPSASARPAVARCAALRSKRLSRTV